MIRTVLKAGSGVSGTARIRTRVRASALDRPRGHALDDVLLTEEVEGHDRDDGDFILINIYLNWTTILGCPVKKTLFCIHGPSQ